MNNIKETTEKVLTDHADVFRNLAEYDKGSDWESEFDKGCNTDNISDPPSDKEWIKAFITKTREEAYEEGQKDRFADVSKTIQEAILQERERVKKNVGLLRQWLNEDRITDKKMVTNEEIITFLNLLETK